jgi:hypothetical protein
VEEDFYHFCDVTGLLGFAHHESKTYDELSKEFLATFKFDFQKRKPGKRGKEIAPTFAVKFRMQNKRIVMSLAKFCEALHLPNTGSWEEVPMSSDNELAAFWASISVDIPDNMHRGKLNHIQHPGLRYFAAFLARGFLARDNSTSCTAPILHLLRCAKERVDPEYNLGVMLARMLLLFGKYGHIAQVYSWIELLQVHGGGEALLYHYPPKA